MSDDYAALITTVILAVLVIGSVQTYTLLKAWGDAMLETFKDLRVSIDNIVQAGRVGQEPAIEDLAKINEARGSNKFLRTKLTALATSIVWLGICATLLTVQIKVLMWSATQGPKGDPDPALAKFAFFTCAASIVILVAEGTLRVVAGTVSGLSKQGEGLNRYTTADRWRYEEALRKFGQAQRDPSSDPPA